MAHATIRARDPLAFLGGRIGVLALGGLIAAAIIAVPALLTMQFLGGSNRPGISYGVAVAGSLAPVNLITLFAPNIFGSLDWSYHYWGPGYETMAEADWTDRAVNYLFVGTVPVVLFVWHGLAGARLFARENRFALLVLAGALLFALGRATPLFDVMFNLVPGVSLYRRPADATFIVNVALAFASAYLLHRYIESGAPHPFRALPGRFGSGLRSRPRSASPWFSFGAAMLSRPGRTSSSPRCKAWPRGGVRRARRRAPARRRPDRPADARGHRPCRGDRRRTSVAQHRQFDECRTCRALYGLCTA